VTKNEKQLLHHEITRPIIGGLYAVHSGLGVGFSEPVYANALSVVLRNAGLRVEREVPFEVIFRGVVVGLYRADLIVESKVVVETKALDRLNVAGLTQLRNYLRAANLSVGLLLNFGSKPEYKRVILTPEFAYPDRPTASRTS
jgi:GxxExxY protein